MTHQVSIFLENKLGHLERVTAVLREAGINILSIHINHTANGWGILNLVVSDPQLARKKLDEHGMSAALREIAVVQMADKPGCLDELLKDVMRAGVNFANGYGRTVANGEKAFFVIDIEDFPDARQKLRDVGLTVVSDAEVYGG